MVIGRASFRFWTVLVFIAFPLQGYAQESTLRGIITDASDGKPLQGANVSLRDASSELTGVVTNRDGFYQLDRIAPGRYALRISFVGYNTYADTLAFGDRPVVTLNVQMIPGDESLDEIVVEGEGGATKLEAGLQTVRPADIARIPTPDASGDLASYLQSLPGVVSLGDRGGALYVRGGTADQNLVLLDGIPIYQPFHIVGFFSAFPSDLVSSVDVYAGGFGPRYSGRVSSVIDVSLREGNKQRFEGAAALSPFLSSLRIEGPVRKGQTSMLASARASVIEQVAPTLIGQSLPLSFGDQLFKLQGAPGENSLWSVTALHTYDQGRVDPENESVDNLLRWNNYTIGTRLLSFPSEVPIVFDGAAGFSYVKNASGPADDPDRTSDALQFSSDFNISSRRGRVELDWGLFLRANWYRYSLSEQFQNLREDSDLLISAGAYVGALWMMAGHFRVNPGVALALYPEAFSPSLEPRLRVQWQPQGPDGPMTWNAALGVYRQTLIGITDERDAGSVFTAWMAAPIQNKQVRSIHALLGWQQRVFRPLTFSVEGYHKRMSNLYVPIWSTLARFTTALTLATGETYGLDTRMEFQKGRFYALLGYGFSTTEYKAAEGNFGVWYSKPVNTYHPPHDRNHQVHSVVSLDIGSFTANLHWQFGSGLPFTQPLGFDDLIRMAGLVDVRTVYGTPRVLYDRPYGGRLPTYHRLDVSIERSFNVPHSRLTLQAGVINMYDRTNLFYYDVFTARRVDQLPLLPYVTFKLETR